MRIMSSSTTNSGSNIGSSGGGGSGSGGKNPQQRPQQPGTSTSSTSSGSGSGSGGQGASRNKCANEKRRREQENIYIEELAELISASIADLSTSMAVKPDKCAILQETVNQIRRIKAAEELAVQQGEVSSSTNILANEILCPLVLEALDGFLFVVNSDGVVEFCSENVEGFVGFKGEELVGRSIYGVVHIGDHARFSGSLLPMSIGWTPTTTPTASTSSQAAAAQQEPTTPTPTPQQKSTPHQRSFNVRLLVKSIETIDSYENMQITAMLMPHPSAGSGAESGDAGGSCLVCIARRLPPNERPPGTPVEQFTTKLSTDGMIIGLDTSGLSAKWVGIIRKDPTISPSSSTLLQELCPPSDLPKLDAHLRETLQNGSSTSLLYKLKLSTDKLVTLQTKSKFFSYTENSSPNNFIMATHTIINPEESVESDFDILDSFETLVSSWEGGEGDHAKPTFLEGTASPVGQGNWPYYEEEELGGGDRLRNLLTNKSENKILKGLLNQEEEEKSENNMLLKLLNEKDKPSGNELLNQLLQENPLKRHAQTSLPPGFSPKQMLLPPPPAPGELCKRNPRLVSLLAKPSDVQTNIPTVPSNYISGTPQEKLFQNIKLRERSRDYHQHHQHQNNNDLILDEILDQVIDIVPDEQIYYSDDVGNILNMLENNERMNQREEVAKINAIQKELMQFESEQMAQAQNVGVQQNLQQVQQQGQQEPVVIHRTTTTTTTQIRYNQQGNKPLLLQNQQQQLTPPPQQQMLQQQRQVGQVAGLQQNVNLQQQREQQLQRQRLLMQLQQQQQQGQLQQNQQQQQQLLQLMRQQQQQQQASPSLDSLLSGSTPPPNVTLVQGGVGQQIGQNGQMGQQVMQQQQNLIRQQTNQQQPHPLLLQQQQQQQQLLLQQRRQQQQQWNQQLIKQQQQQMLQGGQQMIQGGQQQVLIGQQILGGVVQQGQMQVQQQQRPQSTTTNVQLLTQLSSPPNQLLLSSTTPQQLSNPLLNAQLSNNPQQILSNPQQQMQQQTQQMQLLSQQQRPTQPAPAQYARFENQQQQQFRLLSQQRSTNQNYIDVRQELRAVVGARQQVPQGQQQGNLPVNGVPDLEALGIVSAGELL